MRKSWLVAICQVSSLVFLLAACSPQAARETACGTSCGDVCKAADSTVKDKCQSECKVACLAADPAKGEFDYTVPKPLSTEPPKTDICKTTCASDTYCGALTDADTEKQCNTDCNETCIAASDPKSFDFVVPEDPPPPKKLSDDCGSADQECCDDEDYDDCREGLVRYELTQGTESQCSCFAGCKKELTAASTGDDCASDHACMALPDPKAPNDPDKKGPLVCAPSNCDPKGGRTSADCAPSFPFTRCLPLHSAKPTVGICMFDCLPQDENVGCTGTQLCYPIAVSAKDQSGKTQTIPVNVCTDKVAPAKTLGQACTTTYANSAPQGQPPHITGTDDCAATLYCLTTPPPAGSTTPGPALCRKDCFEFALDQSKPNPCNPTTEQCVALSTQYDIQGYIAACLPK